MKIPLDRQSSRPVYRQIYDHLRRLIQSGALQAGDRLPSIRALADELQVNKLTVIEAYNLLEADGVIHARPGSGYFVNEAVSRETVAPSTFSPHQDVLLPDDPQEMSYFDIYVASTLASHQRDVILFSSGFPQPTGLKDLQRIARRAVRDVTEHLFTYGLPQGQPTLRKQIAQLLVQQGLNVSPDDLIVTNGSMQALHLVMHHYVKAGDWVVVEAPTYHGALAILQTLGARIIGIPMTPEGMNLELLSAYLASHRPRLIYTISSLHNPTGITTSQAHRDRLLHLVKDYDCLVLEDNACDGLSFGDVPPPLKAGDRQDQVIYIGTFSKTLMPGLRIGFMVVTGTSYHPLVGQKLLQDLSSSTVSQAIVSEYLASGHYRHHLNQLRKHHLQGRNVMVRSLERHFPKTATWTVPEGGFFLWVSLPADVDATHLCSIAATHKVIVADGSTFFPNHQGYPAWRLNFSQPLADIEAGIASLGRLLHQYHG
jgi:DNA-binding transcriptional MocR family regulator